MYHIFLNALEQAAHWRVNQDELVQAKHGEKDESELGYLAAT